MLSTTAGTFPVSYFETCKTDWSLARVFRPAARTGLSAVRFVDFLKRALVSTDFIRKVCFELVPSSIQNRFSHLGFCELGCAYVTDYNRSMLPSNSAGFNVIKMFSSIFDFRVNSSNTLFVVGSLSDAQLRFKSAIDAFGFQLFAIAQGRHIFQPKVDANRAIWRLFVLWRFSGKGHKPFATGFLGKASGLEGFVKITVPVEPELGLLVSNAVTVEFYSPSDEWHPSKRAFAATRLAKLRNLFMGVTAVGELGADTTSCVRMNAKLFTDLLCSIHQIKMTKPRFRVPPLQSNAVVPDLVRHPRLLTQHSDAFFVFDSETVGKYHAGQYTWCSTVSQPMELRKTRGAVFCLNYHLVFVTKYRRKVFDQAALDALGEQFEEICSGLNCDLVEFNGEFDHVHLLVNMLPSVSVSALVNALKGASSRILRKERPDLHKHFWDKKVLWSPSYFASTTGGAPLEVVKKYVQNQGGGLASPA